jgi:hypothetical protein
LKKYYIQGFLEVPTDFFNHFGGRRASETAARRFQKRNGRYITASEAKRLQIHSGYMQRPFPPPEKNVRSGVLTGVTVM